MVATNLMNKKSAIGIAVIMAGITLTSMSSGEVFAQNDPQRNNFGEGASHLGQNQLMGGHSREGGSAGTAPFDGPDAFDTEKGRTGIGNIAHPADVADTLCPAGSTNPLCPPS